MRSGVENPPESLGVLEYASPAKFAWPSWLVCIGATATIALGLCVIGIILVKGPNWAEGLHGDSTGRYGTRLEVQRLLLPMAGCWAGLAFAWSGQRVRPYARGVAMIATALWLFIEFR